MIFFPSFQRKNVPRSMETWGFFSAGGGRLSRGGGKNGVSKVGKAAQKDEGKLSVGSVSGSSLMPLSVVQGDQRGEATAEEGLLWAKRASRRSSVSAAFRLCRETSSTRVTGISNPVFYSLQPPPRVTQVSLLTSLNVVHGWFLWQHVMSSVPPSRRSARSTPHDTWKKVLLRTRC